MIEMTDKMWSDVVLPSVEPVLVDIYSPTCVPCKMLGRVLDAMEEKHEDLTVVRMNIDVALQIPEIVELNITSVPALLFVQNGKVHQMSRTFKEEQILEEMNKLQEETND